MLHKLKPTLGAKYPQGYLQSCFLFKDPVHPIWESYLSEYLETTQSDLNEHITFNQFLTISWRYGLPQYVIEFVSQLVGNRDAVKQYFQRIFKGVQTLTNQDAERVLKVDQKLQKCRQFDDLEVQSDHSVQSWDSQHSD